MPSGDEGLKKESLYKECDRRQASTTQAAANSMKHFTTAMLTASIYGSVYVKLLTWWMSWIN